MKNKSGLIKKLVLGSSIALASIGTYESSTKAYDILSDPASPANPCSPLSPANPANPASPLNPLNDSKVKRPLTDKEKDFLKYALYGTAGAVVLIGAYTTYKRFRGDIF